MSKFKPGDKVKAISPHCTRVKLNKIYTVLPHFHNIPNWICLEEANNNHVFHQEEFRLATVEELYPFETIDNFRNI